MGKERGTLAPPPLSPICPNPAPRVRPFFLLSLPPSPPGRPRQAGPPGLLHRQADALGQVPVDGRLAGPARPARQVQGERRGGGRRRGRVGRAPITPARALCYLLFFFFLSHNTRAGDAILFLRLNKFSLQSEWPRAPLAGGAGPDEETHTQYLSPSEAFFLFSETKERARVPGGHRAHPPFLASLS